MSAQDTDLAKETAQMHAQMRVLELFGAVCADPDNRTVTDEADRALHELDALIDGPSEGAR